jgi:hypothetical protein
MNAFIRLLYELLVAAAIVIFIGFGTYSFYQSPKYPDYPTTIYDSPGYQQEQDKFTAAIKKYNEKNKVYQRNITYIILPAAAILLALGLFLFRSMDVIGEGIAFGGAATSIYAIVTSSMADARVLRFLSVTLFLISALLITYRRFHTVAGKIT